MGKPVERKLFIFSHSHPITIYNPSSVLSISPLLLIYILPFNHFLFSFPLSSFSSTSYCLFSPNISNTYLETVKISGKSTQLAIQQHGPNRTLRYRFKLTWGSCRESWRCPWRESGAASRSESSPHSPPHGAIPEPDGTAPASRDNGTDHVGTIHVGIKLQ